MNADKDIVAVKILDRTYNIKCPPDEAQALQESARHLDEQMRQIRQSGNITSTDRVAIVTALNISHELMQLKNQKDNYINMMNHQIQDIQKRIQNFLAEKEEIAV